MTSSGVSTPARPEEHGSPQTETGAKRFTYVSEFPMAYVASPQIPSAALRVLIVLRWFWSIKKGAAFTATLNVLQKHTGKARTTVARAVAKRLGLIYADTGKLYRALALKAADAGISVDDKVVIEALCGETDIAYRYIDGESRVFLDGADVTDKLTASETVGELASALSALPEVRAALLEVQRSLADFREREAEIDSAGKRVEEHARELERRTGELDKRQRSLEADGAELAALREAFQSKQEQARQESEDRHRQQDAGLAEQREQLEAERARLE